MKRTLFFAHLLAVFSVLPLHAATLDGSAVKYEANWESLNSRPCPEWFPKAKFGIFVVWGPYSVPAYRPNKGYAEWIGHPGRGWMKDEFIRKTYGENVTYEDFGRMFKAELFDPNQWAEIFARSGARYVVLTAKYHDGFCLWPTEYAKTRNTDKWHSGAIGPKRDLVGELTAAVRARGMKMGLYWSLAEWFHPLCCDGQKDIYYCADPQRYAREHMFPQFKEMVNRYKPSLIFGDGDWVPPEKTKTPELVAWLYNQSPVRDEVVINDRFGLCKRDWAKVGDYYCTEYGAGFNDRTGKPWEENRGMGTSYGYNRMEGIDQYKSGAELVHFLIDMVSKGGNLLLDVGPTADGRIPVIMQERLGQIGDWLRVNGEAIYDTHRWSWDFYGEGLIRYTARGDDLYAICLQWPGPELV
ncbi:MAG: alpha-L-fucosidase, partial [Planctomycetota bacterium]